jgi:hypothetical protein
MKKLMLTLLIVLMACPVFAVDVVTNMDFGCLFKDGGKFAFGAGLNVPLVTKESAGFKMYTQETFLYSDKAYGTTNEIEAIRAFVIGEQKFYFLDIGLGFGTYWILSTSGETDKLGAYKAYLGTTVLGVQLQLGADAIPLKNEADMYYVYGKIAFISL